ncbi:MAG: glycosyltransferase [Verrucomicrobiaceae bacterium]
MLLTAGFGDGHNTAARNIGSGLNQLAPQDETRVLDLCDLAHPLISPLLKNNYQMLITRAPVLWGRIFSHTAKMDFSGSSGVDMLAGLRRELRELLLKERPRAIISTYPVYSKIVQTLRAEGLTVPPLFTVVTDSITIHGLWMLAPSDRYFVADEDSKQALAAMGAENDKIFATGFPVHLDFTKTPLPLPDLPQGRILYLPSTGERHVGRTLESLRPLLATGTHLTLPVGKHASRLYHTVTRFTDSLPGASIEVLGWTNQIPRLLQTHDLVICKAGGAILHEALAARCPAIIDYIVPGQEEGNAELLVKHDCGVVTRTPAETGVQAVRLLANNRAEAKRMKANALPLSEPEASLKIARNVLAGLAP